MKEDAPFSSSGPYDPVFVESLPSQDLQNLLLLENFQDYAATVAVDPNKKAENKICPPGTGTVRAALDMILPALDPETLDLEMPDPRAGRAGIRMIEEVNFEEGTYCTVTELHEHAAGAQTGTTDAILSEYRTCQELGSLPPKHRQELQTAYCPQRRDAATRGEKRARLDRVPAP